MRIFVWDVAYFCPLQCIYCYSNSGPRMSRADPSQLLRVAAAIAREKPDGVMISGGDPALIKGIEDVGHLLRSNGIVPELLTSGWGLDEARIERLFAAFHCIHVSLDSADANINDRIRGREGAHRNAANTLRLLNEQTEKNRALRFGVECTVVRSNLHTVAEYCQFVTQSFPRLRFINIAPAVPSGRATSLSFCNTELLDETQVALLLGQTRELSDLLPPTVKLTIGSNCDLKIDDDDFIQINANGDVRAMKICKKVIGNLVDEPLSTILARAARWRNDSPLAQSLRVAPNFLTWADLVRRIDAV